MLTEAERKLLAERIERALVSSYDEEYDDMDIGESEDDDTKMLSDLYHKYKSEGKSFTESAQQARIDWLMTVLP